MGNTWKSHGILFLTVICQAHELVYYMECTGKYICTDVVKQDISPGHNIKFIFSVTEHTFAQSFVKPVVPCNKSVESTGPTEQFMCSRS